MESARSTVGFVSGQIPPALGVFSVGDGRRRLGARVGDNVLDVDAMASEGRITSVDPALVTTGRLNELLEAGRPIWEALLHELSDLPDERFLLREGDVTMHLAWDVADYVDFYASRHHAENVGRIFRPTAPPLTPNWLHLPVAYHGRSGTVVVDGTPIRRPHGQRRTPDGDVVFGPTARLDFELELGFVVGGPTPVGEPVPIEEAADHVFGVVLVNDWSARDIQAWETVPLGPFLGKSFATSVSAWVVPMLALQEARAPGPAQADPTPLPYLQTNEPWALDVDLEVWWQPAGKTTPTRVASVNAADGLYWNAAQQLAHLTVNGASLRAGDMFASGTVSGPEPGQRGCLLERTWGGSEPLDVDGATRLFLEDGDRVVLQGRANAGAEQVPLGPVAGTVVGERGE